MKSLLSFFILSMFASVAHAGLIQISNPDASYLGTTTNIAITEPDYAAISSLSDGTLTVNSSNTLGVYTVPSSWSSWSSPPYSESATPRVLLSPSSLTLTFSNPVNIFGIEAQGNPFDMRTFTVSFFNGLDLVGTFTRDIHGDAGARLLAASATGGDVFTRVAISTDTDFGIAQFRYGLATTNVPEPGTLVLLGIGTAGAAFSRRRSKT